VNSLPEKEYVDSNILIHNLIFDSEMGEKAKNYLIEIADGKINVYSSIHLITEVYAFLKGVGESEQKIGKILQATLQFGVKLLPLSAEIVFDVPKYMQKGWKYGDCIHYLTMKMNKIKRIVSDDKFFDKLDDVIRVDLRKEK
jgi:predicted nucleic acid-binding protein